MKFKRINSIDDIRPFTERSEEIRWIRHGNGATVGCYMFQGKHTFDSTESLECRGIAFDDAGKILSRPLHKFFNLHEKIDNYSITINDVAAVYTKLDGSIISTSALTCMTNPSATYGGWCLRSRKSYTSDVVKMATALIDSGRQEYWGYSHFCAMITEYGMTACFEFTSPSAQIVIPHKQDNLTLLHIRDNITGEYVMLDSAHPVHDWIKTYDIIVCDTVDVSTFRSMSHLIEWIGSSEPGSEGFVIQLKDGDMVKVKTKWYTDMHNVVTFMRERDIARLALYDKLDDVRAKMVEVGIDMQCVDRVAVAVRRDILDIASSVTRTISAWYMSDRSDGPDHRKQFAIAHRYDAHFSLLMAKYHCKEVDYAGWYEKNVLDKKFTLNTLGSSAGDIT